MSNQQYSVVIYGAGGHVVRRSRNLAGLREHCGKYVAQEVAVTKHADGTALLFVLFANGDWCETTFASYSVLKYVLRKWRNLYGTPLRINGEWGTVSNSDARLLSAR